MDPGIVTALLNFVTTIVIVIGVFGLISLKIIKGSPRRHSQAPNIEETRLIQELYQGLSRLEERVESLETLLLDRNPTGKDNSYDV